MDNKKRKVEQLETEADIPKIPNETIAKLYKPDYGQLAETYESFRPFVFTNKQGNPSIDWKNADAVRELNKTLLHSIFNVHIALPPDQLCPTVTSRFHYIQWISELLEIPREDKTHHSIIKGIDIGTGASCIYPLIGAAMHPNWKLLATDIDPISLEWAKKNIELNHWDRIELRQSELGKLLHVIRPEETFDFCMCNPPFFSDMEQTGKNEKVICTGTENELVTEGGEVQFVGEMIKESLSLRNRIRWYTSLIGRKVSLKYLIPELKKHRIVNYRTTALHQGKTTRWAIAWSFYQDGLQSLVKQKVAPTEQKLKQQTSFTLHGVKHPTDIILQLQQLFTSLGIKHKANTITSEIQGEAVGGEESLYKFQVRLLQIQPQTYMVDFKQTSGSARERFYDMFRKAEEAVKR